jgi:GNAT superfamily N-acetyltransferase
MGCCLERATPEDVKDTFSLYERRVEWMEQKGIRHWNVNGYLDIHNKSYFKAQQKLGNLHVLKNEDGRIVAAGVLLDVDPRWPDGDDMAAYYVHNFVADPQSKGAGKILLRMVEDMAAAKDKAFVRLDCNAGNEVLNCYYDELGFLVAGVVNSGFYVGYLREKRVHIPAPASLPLGSSGRASSLPSGSSGRSSSLKI